MRSASDRIPFSPRTPPGLVCAASMMAMAFALLPVVQRALQEVSHDTLDRPEAWLPPLRILAAPALIGAALLAVWVTRADRPSAAFNTVFGGAFAVGLVSGVVVVIAGSDSAYPLASGATLAAGTPFGLLYGAMCAYPVAQLAAARQLESHATVDVQLSNTAAWTALVATGGFFAAPTTLGVYGSAALATSSLTIALVARLRHYLRRRWLRRVLRGACMHWSIERQIAREAPSDDPVIELLAAGADERFVVWRARSLDGKAGNAGNLGPYRGRSRARVLGRLSPAF